MRVLSAKLSRALVTTSVPQSDATQHGGPLAPGCCQRSIGLVPDTPHRVSESGVVAMTPAVGRRESLPFDR